MRSGIRGVLAGALALIALQTIVQAPAAARVGGLFKVPAQVARWFIDPSVPGIPDTQARIVGKVGAGGKAGELGSGLRAGLGQAAGSTSAYPDPFTPPKFTPVPPGGD